MFSVLIGTGMILFVFFCVSSRFLSVVARNWTGHWRMFIHSDRRRVHWSTQWHDGKRVRYGRSILPKTQEQLHGFSNGSVRFVCSKIQWRYEKVQFTMKTQLFIRFYCQFIFMFIFFIRFTYRAYNFYTFPKPMSRYAPDCRFLCQSSSMEFLSNHNFDFNKLFKHGAEY